MVPMTGNIGQDFIIARLGKSRPAEAKTTYWPAHISQWLCRVCGGGFWRRLGGGPGRQCHDNSSWVVDLGPLQLFSAFTHFAVAAEFSRRTAL